MIRAVFLVDPWGWGIHEDRRWPQNLRLRTRQAIALNGAYIFNLMPHQLSQRAMDMRNLWSWIPFIERNDIYRYNEVINTQDTVKL